MKRVKADRALLGLSMIGFFAMSVSFMLMPLESMRIIPGLMFWLGMIVGIVFQIVLALRRKAYLSSHKGKREENLKRFPGLISFCTCVEGIIADAACLASIIAAIPTFILTKGYGYACYVLVACVLFTFCLHCIFNGKIFFRLKNKSRAQHALGQRKANLSDKGERENDKQ